MKNGFGCNVVVEMTKYIRTSASKEEDGTAFAQFFPKFLWVVRDFSLQLVITIYV